MIIAENEEEAIKESDVWNREMEARGLKVNIKKRLRWLGHVNRRNENSILRSGSGR